MENFIFFAVADDLDCDDDFPFLHGMLNVFSCSIFLLVEILLKFYLTFFLLWLAWFSFQDIRVQNNSCFLLWYVFFFKSCFICTFRLISTLTSCIFFLIFCKAFLLNVRLHCFSFEWRVLGKISPDQTALKMLPNP